MPKQVLINLFIGVLWMFLQDDWSILSFTSGYLFGLFVLFIMRRFLDSKFYLLTLYYAFRLFCIFIYELFTSAVLVIKEIVKPKITIKPGIFSIETSLESDIEVTLISLLITLTPGSVVFDVSPDKKTLYIHAMDIPEQSKAVIRSIEKFEEAIKKVTRS
ncbi:MAG: Na+/H+ antiporter subunit E [Desulfitobacterium sp.]|nr:Na+/H+ antiporter subunit E [Desulfitobacterium sp.]